MCWSAFSRVHSFFEWHSFTVLYLNSYFYLKQSACVCIYLITWQCLSSVLWRCWLGGRKGIWPVKTEWWGAGVVICLERDADLHMAPLMPLPLTASCFRKIQIGFTFLVPAHPGSPGKRAVKRVCVCVFVFSALTPLTGHQTEHLAHKKIVWWPGYLSEDRCKWFVCGPADVRHFVPH